MRSLLQDFAMLCCIALISACAPSGGEENKQQPTGQPSDAVPWRLQSTDEEFRGMVVTTAYNTDWPSQPGLYSGVLGGIL